MNAPEKRFWSYAGYLNTQLNNFVTQAYSIVPNIKRIHLPLIFIPHLHNTLFTLRTYLNYLPMTIHTISIIYIQINNNIKESG